MPEDFPMRFRYLGRLGQGPTAPRPQDITPALSMSTGLGDVPMDPANDRLGSPGPSPLVSSPYEEAWRWAEYPPAWGRWFDKALQITLGASASRSEVVAMRVYPGHFGILRFFANAVGSASDSSFVTFALLVDGSPIMGYSAIVGGKSPALSAPDPLLVPLLSGQRVSVVATNSSSSGIQNVAARIKGWTWAATLQSGMRTVR